MTDATAAVAILPPGSLPVALEVVVPVVLAALAAGLAAALSVTGPRALDRLVSRPPERREPLSDPALAADLVAAALRTGAPTSAALRGVAAVCEAGGLGADLLTVADACASPGPARRAGMPVPERVAALHEAVAFADATGAPVAQLVAQAAVTLRRRRRDAAAAAAGRLAALLVLPLGLAALPGFLLLGIAPVVLRLVTSLA